MDIKDVKVGEIYYLPIKVKSVVRAKEFQRMFRAIAYAPQKCSECVAYHAEGNLSVPCNGDFPDHCEYNGTEEEEEEADG